MVLPGLSGGLLLGGAGGGGGDVEGGALPAGDENWSDVVLVSTFEGPDSATLFFDDSEKGNRLVANGDVDVQSDEADFDGTGDFISAVDQPYWDFGSGDFTVELFGVSFDVTTGRRGLISQWEASGQRSWCFEWRGDATPDDLMFIWSLDGSASTFVTTDEFTPTIGQEYDLCAERSGSTLRVYIDGVLRGSGSISGTLFNSTQGLEIGRGSNKAGDYHDGQMKAARITKGVARYADDGGYTVPTLPLPKAPTSDAMLFSFDAGSRVEAFIDQSEIDSITGLNTSVMPLIKYASNPVLPNGTNSDTWDRDKYYVNALYESSTYKVWYGNIDDLGAYAGSSYATSSDGQTWTKPNLGQVTYDGNANNNIFDAKYDPTIQKDGSTYYILLGADASGASNNQALIYSSADGFSGLTLEKTITHGSYAEFHGLTKRADGRWLAYYAYNHGADQRHIGAYLSDTTDITGAWTDQGQILAASATQTQYYYLSATLIDGVLYGLAGRYDSTREIIWLHLLTSTDGLVWTSRRVLLWPGPDSYDIGMIFAKSLIDDGSELRVYYGGSAGGHGDAVPRDSRLCYASLDTGRLGAVHGAGGNVVTTAFTPSSGLKINANSSGGKLSAELLDPSDDSVLTGFAKADCDSLDGNFSVKEVTWSGASIPTDQSVKIKFYLDA